ncbi:MAG: sensor histidine kinase [Lachnospiraceae bacterium]|nr:sensor histidine kinase [Lachnospiraceae bacterium]
MKPRKLIVTFKYLVVALGVWLAAACILTFFLITNYSSDHVTEYMVTFILMLAFLIAIIYAMREKIEAPIIRFGRKLSLFNEGIVFNELFDDMADLSDVSEETAGKLKELLDKDRMIENAKQQARYLALQNQINPHFLYNVLESIRSDALMAGAPEIGKIAEALAVYFRYTTSKMENLSTLQEELGNVETYFLIQKYRFEDKIALDIRYDTEDRDVLKIQIPKLTLQPIVENAIKHGLEPQVEGGSVTISVEHTDRNVFISVSDNGVGIDEERLAPLNEKLEKMYMGDESLNESGKGGIALINVNSRIRLLMGEEYGIHIFSTAGLGTEVRITLPYMMDEGVV